MRNLIWLSYLTFPQACDKNPTDQHKLDYGEFNPFYICAESYTPIYKGEEKVECAFCTAKFKPGYRSVKVILIIFPNVILWEQGEQQI